MNEYGITNFSSDLLNAFRDSLCVLNSQGDIIAVNDIWIKFSEENGALLSRTGIGMNYYEVCGNAVGAGRDEALRFAAGIKDVMNGSRQVFTMEYECSSLTEERWFMGRVTSFLDRVSGEKQVLIVHENISEIRKKNLELRKLSLAVEQSPSTVVITDVMGNIEYVNRKFVELTGYTLEEARGKNPRILKSGMTPSHVYSDMWKSIKSGRVWRGTFLNKNRNGSHYWESAIISPIFSESGEIINYMAVKEDITERKQAEDELKKSREQYALAVRGSRDGIWDWDLNTDQVYFSPRYKEILGYADDEMESTFSEFEKRLHPEDKERVLSYVNNFIAGKEETYTLQFRLRHREGCYIWIQGKGIVQRDEMGKAYRLSGSHADISEMKLNETVLQTRLDLLTYSASHNLNDSLRKILDDVCEIMESPIGFYHFVEDDGKSINLQVWSTRTMNEFCQAEGSGAHYNIENAGVWVDCVRQRRAVIHNDYASLPHKRGLPEGHAEVIRELVVPVIREDRVTALLGIGNRKREYTENDVQIVSFFADLAWVITERKRAEDDLKYQSLLLSNVSDAIISTDTNYAVITWNRGAEAIYGIEEKDALGNLLSSLLTTQYVGTSHDEVIKEFMDKGSWQGEVVQVINNGRKIDILSSVTLLKDDSGAPAGAVAVNRDITEKKRIENGIMREYNLHAALSEIYAPMMKSDISISDIAKIILYWGRYLTGSEHGFVSTIDRSTGDMISHTLTEMLEGACAIPVNQTGIVFSRDPHGKFPSLFGYSINTGESIFTNDPPGHPESSGIPEGHIPLRSFLSVPVYLDDEIAGLIALANSDGGFTEDDLTAVKRLAGYYAIAIKRQRDIEKLENARLFAESANRAKSEFIAAMSHELRTPLNSILGFSQLLEMKTSGELTADQLEYVGYIRSSGTHLLDMINEILDLAKIEAGRIQITKKIFDLPNLLNSFSETIKPLSLKKNIRVHTSVSPDVGLLEADEVRVRQILFNLLSNSVKFTSPDRDIGIEAYGDGTNAVITVWDEGPGIAADDQERIFSPFEQAGTIDESLKGTGLGLSITKKLVELHGGRIFLDSAPGKGSRFTVIIPGRIDGREKADASAGSEEIPAPDARPEYSATVLIVEDEPANQALLQSMFRILGISSVLVSSGEEAVSAALSAKFDLILMDINLPGIDGIEAMKQIRLAGGAHTPVVALTAHAMKGDEERFIMEGMDGVLSKPFDAAKLKALVEGFLSV